MAYIENIKKLFEKNEQKMEAGFTVLKQEVSNVQKDMALFKAEIKLLKLLKQENDLHRRFNNILLHNIEETESPNELPSLITKLIQDVTQEQFSETDLNDV